MKLKIYQVDAFTDKLFGGNPAAICPLDSWLSDELMQSIAAENNLAETAFFISNNDQFEIRWFTPTIEVDLCGHATIASAQVIFDFLNYKKEEIIFNSRSGKLTVRKTEDLYYLNFPSDVIKVAEMPSALAEGLKINPKEVYKGKSDYFLVFDNQKQIESLQPDFNLIAKVQSRGIIVTAKGDHVDFVSRFFAPQSGINEDPVTGSAHTTLIPYWAKVLNKKRLTAMQLSQRKGTVLCEFMNNRVLIGGKAVTYLTGEIFI